MFARTLKNVDEVFIGFTEVINASGDCHFTHKTAYSNVLETFLNKRSEALLDEMQTCYPNILNDPRYPITWKHVTFSIPLVDEKLPPPKRKLYPLSEPELKELRE